MNVGQVTPAGMAEIYYSREHFGAVKSIKDKLAALSPKSASWEYWNEVFTLVQMKAMQSQSYKSGTVPRKEGEAVACII